MSEAEWLRFCVIAQSVLRPWELAYIDYQEGRISPQFWESQHQAILFYCARTGFRRFFNQFRMSYYADFRDYLEELIRSIDVDRPEVPDLLDASTRYG